MITDPSVQAQFRSVESHIVGHTKSSTPLLTQLSAAGDVGTGFPLTALSIEEQSVLDYNHGLPLDQPGPAAQKPVEQLVAFYPSDGTLLADHPFVSLKGALIDADERAATEDLRRFLLSEPAQARLRQAGFRDRDGQADPQLHLVGNGVLAQRSETLRPTGHQLMAALEGWTRSRRAANALLVTDVSASMGQPSGQTGRTRQEQAAALVSGFLEQETNGDRIGMWTSSPRHGGRSCAATAGELRADGRR